MYSHRLNLCREFTIILWTDLSLIHISGDEVEMSESKLNTLAGTMYYYTIEPALAMSDNIPALRRLTSLHATVKEVKYENSVYTVVAYCE